jgi:ATP synthase protein I
LSDKNAQMPGVTRDPAAALRRDVRRVVWAQSLLTFIVAALFGYRDGPRAALAAVYGGAVTLWMTVWLGWRLRRVGAQAGGLAVVYSSVVWRYATAIVMLALGLGVLKLTPLPLVIAFGLTQFGFLANARRR